MSTYTYTAINTEGRKIYGALNLASEDAVKQHLESDSLLNIVVYKSATRYVSNPYKNVPAHELHVFCRQISVIYTSQIALLEGIVFLAGQTENKQLKIALSEIHTHMSNGIPFAEAIGMYPNIFNSYLVSMVAIGETSGTLDSIFSDLADYYEKEAKIRKKIRSAVAYPAVLTVLMSAIVLFLIIQVLPMFQETLYKMGGDIPEVTKAILSVSTFLQVYLPYIGVAIVLLIIAAIYYSKTTSGSAFFDRMKVSLPFSKYINSRVITARLARSLSILLKSGVHLLNALDDVVPLIDNSYIQKQFVESVKQIKNGEDVTESLSKIKIFPPLFLKMINIGQITGNLDEMLARTTGIFDDEVDESLNSFTVMIEPLLIIILSIIVGIILVSVMLPMISIMNNIG